ncbi:MAG: SDR family NAD(P)-dependent oxidoreductase [Verrucomicrobia subdivision 3 bacterium]|nr:SDR family NAD(P)-dependent oxidoreductase [Limisphaerales bacterium]
MKALLSMVPNKRLADKVSIVTGAASGIGRATALLFAGQGSKVAVADVDEVGAAAAVREAGAHDSALAVRLDVSAESSWTNCIETVVARWGRLDVLVNCAGVAVATPVETTSLEEWRRVHAVNLDGVFLGTRAGIRAMRGRGGCIINIASLSGIEVFPGAAAYASSKAAVIQFSKVAAAECAHSANGVRITVIAPGGVKTPMWKTTRLWQDFADGGEEAAWRKLDPQNCFYEPEEIAECVLETC